MDPEKRLACLLVLLQVWTSLPWSAFAQEGLAAPAQEASGYGISDLSPSQQLEFTSQLGDLLEQMDRASSAPEPLDPMTFVAQRISEPGAGEMQVAAGEAVLNSLSNPDFLSQLTSDLGAIKSKPETGRKVAHALKRLVSSYHAKNGARALLQSRPADSDGTTTRRAVEGPWQGSYNYTLGAEVHENVHERLYLHGLTLPKKPAPTSLRGMAPDLLRLRSNIQNDAKKILKEQLGGEADDGALQADVSRVMGRVLKAAGLSPDAAQIFIGASLLPNAFTAVTPAEKKYFEDNPNVPKTLRVSNIFLSLGLLRAVQSEARLAAILAHELTHNLKGHLRESQGTHLMLGHFQELEADAEGLKLAAAAGYDPEDAAEFLYDLEREYKNLESQYTLLKRDKNDLTKALQRVRDLHPDDDLRRANLLDHMDEAHEAYRAADDEAGGAPVWMERRLAAQQPGAMDLFRARLAQENITTGPIEKNIHALETFIARESVGKTLGIEEYAMLEEAFRAVVFRAESMDDLRLIEVSLNRGKQGPFPSRNLKASLITRQLELVLRTLPKNPTLEDFVKACGPLGMETRRAGALRLLGSIRSRKELDAAYKILSREAETLGLISSGVGDAFSRKIRIKSLLVDGKTIPLNPTMDAGLSANVASRLWRAARRVLTQERGRSARPEEIIDELKEKLIPSLIKNYYDALNVEIIESAFGPEPYRSKGFRPSQLATRLRADGEAAKEVSTRNWTGFPQWAERHYSTMQAGAPNGKLSHRYERYYLDGLSAPSVDDQLDLLSRFANGGASSIMSLGGHYDFDLPRPFLRLLRWENKLDSFLQAALRKFAADLIARPDKALTAPAIYASNTKKLLSLALADAKDFPTALRTLELFWKEILPVISSPREQWRDLGMNFSAILSDAFARILTDYDSAGKRPSPEELRALGDFVRRVERELGASSGVDVIKGHARNLAAAIGDRDAYLQAYRKAVPNAFGTDTFLWDRRMALSLPLEEKGWRAWLARQYQTWIVGHLEHRARPLLQWGKERDARYAKPPITAPRALTESDFIYFLVLLSDPQTDAQTKLMAAALLDRFGARGPSLDIALASVFERSSSQSVPAPSAAPLAGRLLLEETISATQGAGAAQRLAQDLLRLREIHPTLLQGVSGIGDKAKGFQQGARYALRNEVYRSLATGRHPFRNVNARWGEALVRRLDETGAWPADTTQVLDLLDFLNSSGEFSELIDQRIIAVAKKDRPGFLSWIQRDERRLDELWFAGGGDATIEALGDQLPLKKARPLRIVRNPALRAQLFDLLPEADLTETPQRPWRERIAGQWKLYQAYRAAKEYYSDEFLKRLRGAKGDKLLEALEETERVASERAEAARRRWDRGQFKNEDSDLFDNSFKDDFLFFMHDSFDTGAKRQVKKEPIILFDEVDSITKREGDSPVPGQNKKTPAQVWSEASPEKKERIVERYKAKAGAAALVKLKDLGDAYAAAQDPLLGFILENYPEPTRWRDDLLERVIKARRLSPEDLAFLESHKSYRQPNPLRYMEKQLLDLTVLQIRKFSPAERVDILLDIADIKGQKLSPEKEREYNGRLLNKDRKKLARDVASIRKISELKSYLSLLHPKDRSLIVRAMFYGETSLHSAPEEVNRLFEKLVIENRDLPPFLEKTLRAYFRILNKDEKARLLGDLAAMQDLRRDLTGPTILKIALQGKVTGAKISQVLSTHQGLLPQEYADALSYSKDRAQDVEKMKVYEIMMDRLAAILGNQRRETAGAGIDFDKLALDTLPDADEATRLRLAKQVKFLLQDEAKRIKSVVEVGPELGSGSIKVVYKVELDDNRTWVVKVRAPGSAYRINREFEILDSLIKELQKDGVLDASDQEHAGQLFGEVKKLTETEMGFRGEAAKESDMLARTQTRPWYTKLLSGGTPFIPKPHPIFVSDDIMIEEFATSTRFADLPDKALWGPSKAGIAKLAVDEGLFGLVFDEWLEPDPHTGNRNAKKGGLANLLSRLVVIDLGQGEAMPIERVKPIMKAGLALQSNDAPAAAKAILSIMGSSLKHSQGEIQSAVEEVLKKQSRAGAVERFVAGLVAAEKMGALPRAEYASLEKAFLFLAGYSQWLPKDYLDKALERAIAARFLRDRPISILELISLQIRKAILGPAAVRKQLESLIDGMPSRLDLTTKSSLTSSGAPVKLDL